LTRKQAHLVLNAISQIGPVTYDRLMAVFGADPLRVLGAGRNELKRVEGVGDCVADALLGWETAFDLEMEEDQLERRGARFIDRESEEYSPLLKEIYDPPIGLYQIGPLSPGLKRIAIVGSRRCTLYGRGVARQMGKELARMGFCVVSGMARGIDSAAHEGAIEGGGLTAAIMGCGLDIIYPPENKDLYNHIKEKGAVISEFIWGRRADKRTFPMRNRIVSGMAQAVVVVETDRNGGSMITARMAGEQGRQVFAVPGRIDQPSSYGCHELIRDGASLCRGVDDILEELSYLKQMDLGLEEVASKQSLPEGLSENEKKVYRCLSESGNLSIDAISKQTFLGITDVSSLLLLLELKKLVTKRVDGTFEAVEAFFV